MKNHHLLLISCLLILCAGCETSMHKVTGDYSYKQSGLVVFTDAEGQQVTILATKQGQLNILKDRQSKGGDILVTFNEMGGGTYVCDGKIKGDSIFLSPHEFSTRFSTADSVLNLTQLGKVYTVQSTGRGVIREDMILMEESWTGRPEDGTLMRLHADKITLLAEKN